MINHISIDHFRLTSSRGQARIGYLLFMCYILETNRNTSLFSWGMFNGNKKIQNGFLALLQLWKTKVRNWNCQESVENLGSVTKTIEFQKNVREKILSKNFRHNCVPSYFFRFSRFTNKSLVCRPPPFPANPLKLQWSIQHLQPNISHHPKQGKYKLHLKHYW